MSVKTVPFCSDCPSRDPYILAMAAAVMEGGRKSKGPFETEVEKVHRIMGEAARALRIARKVAKKRRAS